MRVEVQSSERVGILKVIVRIFSDPFYYAMSIPSLAGLLFFAILLLAAVSWIMVGVWYAVKTIAMWEVPVFDESKHPIKMFIAGGCAVVYTLCAGVIHRRLTRAEVRGKFISFSKIIKVKNGNTFVFSLIDKRHTQLIGTSLTIELVTVESGSVKSSKIPLGSPGILAIPTEIIVPVEKVFPSLANVTSCDQCGQDDFRSIQAYSAHMSYFHGVAKRETKEELASKLAEEVAKVDLFRIRLCGVDEVSGKVGRAIKEYSADQIVLSTISSAATDDTFSVISRPGGDISSGESEGETDSTPMTASSATGKRGYVHVDFRYN